MSCYLRFDGMTWPDPGDPNEIEYTLRHAHEHVTPSVLLQAASFLAAYKQLVSDPVRVRNEKVRGIRSRARGSRA